MFRAYISFCQHYGLQDIAPDAVTVTAYIEFLTRTFQSHRAIMNYVSAIRVLHKMVGVPCTAVDSYDVHLMLRAVSLTLDRTLPVRQPITLDVLVQLVAICDALPVYGPVYKCIFIIAFFGLLRLSNLVPDSAASFKVAENLCCADVWEQDPGLIVMMRWAKTQQKRSQPLLVALPCLSSRSNICPVAAFKAYRALVPYSAKNPMFTFPDGRIVTKALVRKALKLMLIELKFPPTLLTFHGFRKGGAQLYYDMGLPIEDIKAHGGWASDCVWQYIAPGRFAPATRVPRALMQYLETRTSAM